MAKPVTASYNLMVALAAAGARLPEEIVDVNITVPMDGMMQITYRCNVDDTLARQIGEALLALTVADRLQAGK